MYLPYLNNGGGINTLWREIIMGFINSNLFKEVLPLITLLIGIWAAIYSYNEFIADNRQQALKTEITTHIDQSIDSLKVEMRNLPSQANVENAQLRAMIYSKDLIDEKSKLDGEKIKNLERRMDEVTRAVSKNGKLPYSVGTDVETQ